MSLRRDIATPDGKARYVKRLFATIADRYDFITVFLSYGMDRRWKRRLIQLAALQPDDCVLDCACGTGDLTYAAAPRVRRAVGLDLTVRMLQLATRKRAGGRAPQPGYVAGDMLALPFPDASFDVVTAGYGLRNVPDLARALDEVARVLVPRGRFLSLDFNRPEHPLVRGVYLAYLSAAGSLLGLALHRDPDTYRYIPESIRRYPGATAVGEMMRRHGFDRVRVVPLLGGLMAIHVAVRGDGHKDTKRATKATRR